MDSDRQNVAIQRLQRLRQHLVPEECAAAFQDSKQELQEFADVYPVLEQGIMRELPSFDMPPHARDWIQRLVRETVQGGKMNRGVTVLHSYQQLLENQQVTRSEAFKAQVLGWCVEWLQAFFLVADDIMDQSLTRRGKPCWYRNPHPLGTSKEDLIGNIAINDSFILEAFIYRILQQHFGEEPYYVDLLNLFHDVSYRTELGQLLDLTSNLPGGKVDLSLFTLANYQQIVKYKTAYYSFYMPVALAMLLAGIRSKPAFQIAEDILLPMGEYFQIQDDFLDCYGDPKVIGKIGRDIEENKCSWLIVQALLKCSPQQRSILEKHYGRDDPKDVAIVKKIYADLDMTSIYREYEEQSYKKLCAMIDKVHNMPKQVFLDLLGKIYKRKL